jgi:hypothetical protein
LGFGHCIVLLVIELLIVVILFTVISPPVPSSWTPFKVLFKVGCPNFQMLTIKSYVASRLVKLANMCLACKVDIIRPFLKRNAVLLFSTDTISSKLMTSVVVQPRILLLKQR